ERQRKTNLQHNPIPRNPGMRKPPRTPAKQHIHRRVENTGKRAANATARHKTTGKTPPQTNTRACHNRGE
ncbi:hypothetical protein ABG932_08780, partial [Bifidobacterium catenulatum]|uniref:hypothetical protein n=1 Tax=Bifidobacterium catenulatum TaxID=1686 RepID=UPI00325B4591